MEAVEEADQRALCERQPGPLGVRGQREVAGDDDEARRLVLEPGVLRQPRRELRELVPAGSARGDEDGEPAVLHGVRDRLELQLAETVVFACQVLADLETELPHHPALEPPAICRCMAMCSSGLSTSVIGASPEEPSHRRRHAAKDDMVSLRMAPRPGPNAGGTGGHAWGPAARSRLAERRRQPVSERLSKVNWPGDWPGDWT